MSLTSDFLLRPLPSFFLGGGSSSDLIFLAGLSGVSALPTLFRPRFLDLLDFSGRPPILSKYACSMSLAPLGNDKYGKHFEEPHAAVEMTPGQACWGIGLTGGSLLIPTCGLLDYHIPTT